MNKILYMSNFLDTVLSNFLDTVHFLGHVQFPGHRLTLDPLA
jgi:hypothetical protein